MEKIIPHPTQHKDQNQSQESQATHYEVIIVGGRVAGSSLAGWLGQAGVRVLLLERDKFPRKHPASSPIISPRAMHILDQLGAREEYYARNTPPSRTFVYEIRNFRVFNPGATLYGRDYGYAVDRARFDEELWHTAVAHPTVTGYQQASVTDLLWEGARVRGVQVRHGGRQHEFTADCVVGADGRFSVVARKVEAPEHHRFTRFPTSAYYAYWDGATRYDEQTGAGMIHFNSPRPGIGFLLLDSADNSTAVIIEGQSAKLHAGHQSAEAFYMAQIQQTPAIARRLTHAEPITKVHGMRDIANFYRQAGGPGWVLTGDALHQKDPVDGQGILDALLSSQLLGAGLLRWRAGEVAWEEMLRTFDTAVYQLMHGMYIATMMTKIEYFYLPLHWRPVLTAGRWLFEDEVYRRQLALLLGRGVKNPANWRPPAVVLRALLKGAGRDLRRLWTKEPRLSMMPDWG